MLILGPGALAFAEKRKAACKNYQPALRRNFVCGSNPKRSYVKLAFSARCRARLLEWNLTCSVTGREACDGNARSTCHCSQHVGA